LSALCRSCAASCCVLHVVCCMLCVACCTCVLQIIRRLQQSLMIRFGVMKILKYSIMVPPPFPPSAPTHPVLHPAVASARGPQVITACYSGARDVVCCLARATLCVARRVRRCMRCNQVIMAIHWSACFWFLVSDLSEYPDSWVRPGSLTPLLCCVNYKSALCPTRRLRRMRCAFRWMRCTALHPCGRALHAGEEL
jgi:hypothetical protein